MDFIYKRLFYLLLLGFGLSLSSCRIMYPNWMFKVPSDYKYDEFTDTTVIQGLQEYKIDPNDFITFQLFTNDGFKLIDLTETGGNTATNRNQRSGLEYSVMIDGRVKLPVLGKVKLAGMSVREAEAYLEERFSEYYNKPFVMVKVTNKRVFVFPGGGSSARTVTLQNENTSLIEAIVQSGGLSENAKAWRVKLIRGSLKNPKVYLIDLSTLEGVKKAELLVQANDIIYVDQVPRVAQHITSTITPYISLFSTILALWAIIGTVNK